MQSFGNVAKNVDVSIMIVRLIVRQHPGIARNIYTKAAIFLRRRFQNFSSVTSEQRSSTFFLWTLFVCLQIKKNYLLSELIFMRRHPVYKLRNNSRIRKMNESLLALNVFRVNLETTFELYYVQNILLSFFVLGNVPVNKIDFACY